MKSVKYKKSALIDFRYILENSSLHVYVFIYIYICCPLYRFLISSKKLSVLVISDNYLLQKNILRLGSIWKMGRSSDPENASCGDARLFYVYQFPDP